MKVIAGYDYVEAYNFGMYSILKQSLRIVLFLCCPIA